MRMKIVAKKLSRLILRLRLKPIHVYCLHHVSNEYDSSICYECDWISEDSFKKQVKQMMNKCTFISLTQAYKKISSDFVRCKEYAVLTFDDGYSSILESLHWLETMGIPYTLFLNAKYLDGESISPHIKERIRLLNHDIIHQNKAAKDIYLKKSDLESLPVSLSSFGSHGYEHLDATSLSSEDCIRQIEKNCKELTMYPQWIPFHAYTWGNHTEDSDRLLHYFNLIPVLMDGQKNYNNTSVIHRELFPSL